MAPTERQIFEAALELAPEDRAGYLEGVCKGDETLRQRLLALLNRHDEAGSFLENPVLTQGLAAGPEVQEASRTPAMAGQVLAGRYELLEPVGEGGMGAVWVAQQTEPVKRPVAVKLIKPGMDSKQVLARFE